MEGDNLSLVSAEPLTLAQNLHGVVNITSDTDVLSDCQKIPNLGMVPMVIYFILRVLWALLALGGNTFTILAVVLFEALHSNANFLVASLAFADILGALTTPLTILRETHTEAPYYVQVCLAEKTLSLMATCANLLNILWIGFERYLYIVKPMHYNRLASTERISILIGTTWALCIILCPVTIFFGHRMRPGLNCKYALFLSPDLFAYYYFPQLFVTVTMTIYFYVAIAVVACKQRRAVTSTMAQPPMPGASGQAKLLKMMATIFGVYFLSILPQSVVNKLLETCTDPGWLQVEPITQLIFWSNTWANPLVYAWQSKKFRAAFKQLLNGRFNLPPSLDET